MHLSEEECVSLCDWTKKEMKDRFPDFYASYIKPLKLKYCLGMGFTDNKGCIRVIISLDRTRKTPYENQDIDLLRYLYPLVNGLHANLFTGRPQAFSQNNFLLDQYDLTRREAEIAALLLRGATTTGISERLCISVNTVYKHTANIYEKLSVKSRSEFIALMGQTTQ